MASRQPDRRRAPPRRAPPHASGVGASSSQRAPAGIGRLRQLLPATTLAGDDEHQRREEGEIDRRRRPGADHGRRRPRQAGRPATAVTRTSSGVPCSGSRARPVGDRRQQETGDRRHGEAEQHLVGVPDQRRKGARQRQVRRSGSTSQTTRAEEPPQAGAEEERAETVGQDRRPGERSAGGGSARAWRLHAPISPGRWVTSPSACADCRSRPDRRTRWPCRSRCRQRRAA